MKRMVTAAALVAAVWMFAAGHVDATTTKAYAPRVDLQEDQCRAGLGPVDEVGRERAQGLEQARASVSGAEDSIGRPPSAAGPAGALTP